MAFPLISKLLESFDELDRCIAVTREVLSQKPGVPFHVLERVEQYADIVRKQRALACELTTQISAQNWDEVTRYVRLINGLSAMIRDDAEAILAGTVTNTDSYEPAQLPC